MEGIRVRKFFVVLFVVLSVCGLFGGLVNAQFGRNYGYLPENWGNLRDHPSFVSYSYGPQIIHIDESVKYADWFTSIRIDGHTEADFNAGRECDWTGGIMDGYSIPVSVGDRVVYSMWIKTEPNETVLNPDFVWHGGYIGFDLYHGNQRLWEYGDGSTTDFNTTGWAYVAAYHHVDYGSDWTFVSMDVTIPDVLFNHTDAGDSLGGSFYADHIIPWFSMRWIDEGETASGWFANPVIFINPSLNTPVPTSGATVAPTNLPTNTAGNAIYSFALWFAVVLVFTLPVGLLCVYPLKLGKWGFFVGFFVGGVLNYVLQVVVFPVWALVMVFILVGSMAFVDMRSGG